MMDNSAAGSTEYGQSRGCEEAGSSKIVVVDLGEAQSEAQVSGLRVGQGKLINCIERIVDDLVDAGTLKSDAQTVVVVLREFAPLPFTPSRYDEEDDPYD
jgi:hypothetical protein